MVAPLIGLLMNLVLACPGPNALGPVWRFEPAPPDCGPGLTRDQILKAVDRALVVMGGSSELSLDLFAITLRPEGCGYGFTAISLGKEQGPSIALIIGRDGKNKTPPWCWFLEECGELEGESPPEVRKD
jgi:hypothetical protein